MSVPKLIPTALVATALGIAHAEPVGAGDDVVIDFYASLRAQVESVSPDRRNALDDYSGTRDAYSRLGVNARRGIGDRLELFGQLEIPLDTANLRIQDPYDQGGFGRDRPERLRVARIGLRGDFGTLVYGQQWMPYYNAIAYPVDMFSSYYSGYATYTAFRLRDTLAYASPDLRGFALSASYSAAEGNRRSTSRIDHRRLQFALAYTAGDSVFAFGVDDRGDTGAGNSRLIGVSASHRAGGLQLAAKFEIFNSGNRAPGGFDRNGNRAVNLYAGYTLGRNTFKLMLADVENYGERIAHLGIDHQFDDDLKFFVEIYREAETAAITEKRGGLDGFNAAASGGRAIAAGLRYDF